MTKVGGSKNFGYGKTLEYAGRQVLKDIYRGHFGTVAAHRHRWESFVSWIRATGGSRDARHITTGTLAAYGMHLRDRVQSGEMAVRYAQNLLSTVNVVVGGMRGDRRVWISPSQAVGTRINARSMPPTALNNDTRLILLCHK